ncbi:MAG: hypothetical protein DRJ52_03180 [Thermoprotei archaeon]|nr:MAG: hypothetical protein DRJ52_03180 [Thermoprotei archaeon]RLF00878.1 MAG: hypothetical protein DRJ63_01260 [Thermoprotei archaeon]HDI75242.1 CBS domain-containing protein [Thermoprotei archaeon]
MQYLSSVKHVLPSSILREALSKAIDINEAEVPVADENSRYLGVVDLRPLFLPSTDILDTRVSNIMVKYPTLSEEFFSPEEAMSIMINSGVRGVPVVRGKSVYTGMFYHRNALEYLRDRGFGSKIKVNQVMRTVVPCVFSEDTLAKAAAVMRRYKVSRVIVTEERRGIIKPIGVLTRTDLLRILSKYSKDRASYGEVVGEKYRFLSQRVREFVSFKLITIDYNEPISNAIALMLDNDVRSLPIVKNSELIGLIASTDIIKTYVRYLTLKEKAKRVYYKVHCNVEELKSTIESIILSKRIPPGVSVDVEFYRRRGNLYEVYVRFRTFNRFVVYGDTARGVERALKVLRKAIDYCRARIFEIR